MQIFDLHCDSVVNYKELNSDFLCKETQFSLNDLSKFKRLCQTMAIFVPDEYRGENALDYFNIHRDYLKDLLLKNSDVVEQAFNANDIKGITQKNKAAIILSVESGAALAGKLENIDYLSNCGVKMLTLVWNGENELGSGNNTNNGLTDFGKKVIKRMEEKEIIVDVSHLNDTGFQDILEIAEKPFIASHSNLRSICSHKRNLTEEQFKEIVKRKGLVGINLHKNFLSDDGKGDLESLLRHVYRMLELGGEDVISCGSDFDGANINEELDGPVKFASSVDFLIQKGIPEKNLNKMFYDNALDFFEKL